MKNSYILLNVLLLSGLISVFLVGQEMMFAQQIQELQYQTQYYQRQVCHYRAVAYLMAHDDQSYEQEGMIYHRDKNDLLVELKNGKQQRLIDYIPDLDKKK